MLESVQTITKTGRSTSWAEHQSITGRTHSFTNSHKSQHDVHFFARLSLLTPPTKHWIYTNTSKCLQKFWFSTNLSVKISEGHKWDLCTKHIIIDCYMTNGDQAQVHLESKGKMRLVWSSFSIKWWNRSLFPALKPKGSKSNLNTIMLSFSSQMQKHLCFQTLRGPFKDSIQIKLPKCCYRHFFQQQK